MLIRLSRKGKFLMVMPLLVVPFICLLFYSFGGGTGKDKAPPPSSGLNTDLPKAALPETDPTDKLSIYQQAEKDSMKRAQMLKNDGFFAGQENSHLSDGAITSPFVRDGEPMGRNASRSRPALSNNEARIHRSMLQLQRELDRIDTSSRHQQHQGGFADDPLRESQQMLQLEQMAQSLALSDKGNVDPELVQLSDMLDKVVSITNPELSRARLREASAKEKDKVFAVDMGAKEDVTDFFQGPVVQPVDSFQAVDSSKGRHSVESRHNGNRFYELGDQESPARPTAISAVIHGTVTVVSGATVQMRLQQDIFVQGQLIPVGNFVYGKCALSGDRLKINIEEIQYRNSIYPVSLLVYGLDGQEGIAIKGTITGDVSRQGAGDALQSLQLAAMDPSITQQAASAGIDAVKSLLRKKVKMVTMTLKAGHPVLLLDTSQR